MEAELLTKMAAPSEKETDPTPQADLDLNHSASLHKPLSPFNKPNKPDSFLYNIIYI